MNINSSFSRLACSLVSILFLALSGCAKVDTVPVVSAKLDVFIVDWVGLEATTYDEDREAMRKAFETDPEPIQSVWESVTTGQFEVDGKSRSWKNLDSSNREVIDFIGELGDKENVFTYAVTSINSPSEQDLILEVGSDDAIKLWLNGELVHENWVFRGVNQERDFVPVKLQEGENQIIAKVASGVGGWGLAMRPLTMDTAKDLFTEQVSKMSIEQIEKSIALGFDIDATNKLGLTALQEARLTGLNIRTSRLLELGATPDLPLPEFTQLVTQLFEDAVDRNSAGLAFLVAKDGEILLQGGLGLSNIEKNTPIDVSTKFRIGSVTKQFTAAAILKLQEEGRLSIEDPLSKYIPDFPRADEVTLRQLLNHTSGIHSYTNEPDFQEEVLSYISPEELVEKIQTFKYDFDPGTGWAYNNSGYFLLGYLVEQVSGLSFDDYLKQQFFQPLGMGNTGVYVNGTGYEDEATGYSQKEGETVLSMDWDMSWAGGAGNMYSTVGDLYLWNEALFGGEVLSPESFKDATTACKLSDGTVAETFGGHYGLGFMLGESKGNSIVRHGGGLHGFSSMLARLAEQELTFITLANSLPPNLNFDGDPFDRVAALAIGFSDQDLTQAVVVSEADLNLEEYVGEYDYIQAINTITNEGGKLFARITGQRSFELHHGGGDSFYLNEVQAEVEFQRDESGEVVGMVHKQNGREFPVKKMAPIEVVEVAPSIMERYLGAFALNEGFKIEITLKDGTMYGQGTGQPAFELLPLSNTEYRAKGINARINFVESGEGEIESFTLLQGGASMTLKRM